LTPDNEACVVDGWHQPIGIERAKPRRIDNAEVPRRIDALVVDADLLAAPQHLLHVD
jgi:hypothetical protein